MAKKPAPPSWDKRKDTRLPAQGFNNKARVDLRVEDFDRLIEQKGVRVEVYRSMFCPNVSSIDGAEHDVNCPLCNGAQFIDLDPIETLTFLQAQTFDNEVSPEGMHDQGTVLATFPRGIEVQYFTLIQLCDFEDSYFQRIQRQEDTDRDILKYRACKVNVAVDKTGKRYYQDNDFLLDPNGSIRWKAGKGPADGEIYSIHYQMKKQFRATRAQHVERYSQIREGGTIKMAKLYEQWLITRDYLVERKDAATGNALGPNQIIDPVIDDD